MITRDLLPLAKPISMFTPDPANARKHSERSYEVVANSLRQFGQRKPIVAQEKDGQFIVRAGNGTLEAAKRLGWTEIAAVIVNEDSVTSTAFAIADNKTAEVSAWDDEVLNQTLKALVDEGVHVEDFGFDLDEFDLAPPSEGLTDEDAVPEVEQNIHNVKLGDVWQLGSHRLMCGDSTVKENVERLMDGKKADMVFTDPPYGISLGEETPEQAKARNRRTDGLKVANDTLQGDELEDFLFNALSTADNSLKEGGAFYVCSPIDAEVRKFISAIQRVDWHYQSGLVWNKSSLSLSRHDYHPKHEIIHYGWKKGAAHTWLTDRKQTTVFDFDKPSRSELHPTTKPVELVSYYIGNVVKSGALVIDVFLGSGSTLIACEKTNRTCYGLELDPHYCSVIIERWQQFTGKTATLESNNTGAS